MANTTFRRLLNNTLSPNTNCGPCGVTPAFGYQATLCSLSSPTTVVVDSIGGFDGNSQILLPNPYPIPSFVKIKTGANQPLICAELTAINLNPQSSTHFIDIAEGTFNNCSDCENPQTP